MMWAVEGSLTLFWEWYQRNKLCPVVVLYWMKFNCKQQKTWCWFQLMPICQISTVKHLNIAKSLFHELKITSIFGGFCEFGSCKYCFCQCKFVTFTFCELSFAKFTKLRGFSIACCFHCVWCLFPELCMAYYYIWRHYFASFSKWNRFFFFLRVKYCKMISLQYNRTYCDTLNNMEKAF